MVNMCDVCLRLSVGNLEYVFLPHPPLGTLCSESVWWQADEGVSFKRLIRTVNSQKKAFFLLSFPIWSRSTVNQVSVNCFVHEKGKLLETQVKYVFLESSVFFY